MPAPQTNISSAVAAAQRRFSIIGNSPALLNAIERAIKVAPINLSVLVTGESGSGKEFFPKIIHLYGARKHKKYIAVNCGAIPEGTIDSELFGHEKGSFTGAISARKGYFEEADGGTIFLDEVAELPLTTQARLLRVLETGEYLKVGSSQVQKTDIRIVAATNVDLLEAVKRGKFREDLYYRLSTIRIEVPNLHDRGDDILLLARKFASDFAEKYMTAPIRFSPEAERFMLVYRWPGNVRQLKNIVDQLSLFEAGKEIERPTLMSALPSSNAGDTSVALREQHGYQAEREMLWQTIVSLKNRIDELEKRLKSSPNELPAQKPAECSVRSLIKYPSENPRDLFRTEEVREAPTTDLPSTIFDAEKEAVIAALSKNNGNRKNAARDLGISERTLYRKLRDLGISSSSPSEENPL